MLLKALTLYREALAASEEGRRLAFLDPDDTIVREVTGIVPKGPAPLLAPTR